MQEEQISIHEAAQEGQLDELRRSLNEGRGTVNSTKDSMHWTPLLAAARSGRLECAQFLIENGADINYHGASSGKSALLLASYAGHLDVVKLLVQHGADVHYRDELGFTALSLAEGGNEDAHPEIALYLKSI